MRTLFAMKKAVNQRGTAIEFYRKGSTTRNSPSIDAAKRIAAVQGEIMELEFENIDWDDIVEAELSGDQETLTKLRDRAAVLKHSEACPVDPPLSPPRENNPLVVRQQPHTSWHLDRTAGGDPRSRAGRKTSEDLRHPPNFCLPTKLTEEDYPVLGGQRRNRKNSLPFEDFPSASSSPCSTATAAATSSYAQAVHRNSKRMLVDRCLSPSEAPLKRSATSDVMTTPTESKTFSRVFGGNGGVSDVTAITPVTTLESDQCDITPETNSLPGKAGLVQRRLFGMQYPEPAKQQPARSKERLTDDHRLTQRQKQIDFGKNTVGYERYIQTVPKWKRHKSNPTTPDKYSACSTRAWQGQIRVWRRLLHKYDPLPTSGEGGQCFTAQDAALCNVDIGYKQ